MASFLQSRERFLDLQDRHKFLMADVPDVLEASRVLCNLRPVILDGSLPDPAPFELVASELDAVVPIVR